jgi:tRNA-dihydrouridine synthase
MNNFWIKIKNKCKAESRPILAIAPMADVTDVAFRTMLNKYGKPDVTWTEFVSANGLMSPGREILSRDLEYSEMERPVVAQLFTNDPDKMEGAARLCEELGFDGIDINMGCPAGIIIDQGAGAKMITTPELAKEVILAAKRGAPNTPISVKTRLGYNKMEWETWIPNILSCDIVALTVHLRTRKEMSLVPAHYELIDSISELVRRLSPETVFLINGDVKSIQEAKDLYMNHDIDGVMIGRAHV